MRGMKLHEEGRDDARTLSLDLAAACGGRVIENRPRE
jgi:hypothetical protein